MPAKGDRDKPRRAEVALEMAGAAAGTGLGLVVGDPALGIAAATALPLAIDRIGSWYERFRVAQAQRVTRVVNGAAKLAGVDVDEVLRRLDANPARQELLVRTLRVAQDAAITEKLVALAVALSNGSSASTDALAWETVFVRALDDCDLAHVALLELLIRWEHSQTAGGERVTGLSRSGIGAQLRTDGPPVDPLMSTLERHGLIRSAVVMTGLTFGFGAESVTWNVTEFGVQFVERMHEVSKLLDVQGSATS